MTSSATEGAIFIEPILSEKCVEVCYFYLQPRKARHLNGRRKVVALLVVLQRWRYEFELDVLFSKGPSNKTSVRAA